MLQEWLGKQISGMSHSKPKFVLTQYAER